MRISLISWAVFCVGITLNTAYASQKSEETPTELPGGFVINSHEMQVLLSQDDIYVVDCRNPFNYGKGHLPGAHSLEYQLNYLTENPEVQKSEPRINLDVLPDNKKNILIFYSHGPTGWKSYRAARTAIAEGYTQVHWFRGGVKAWQSAGYELEY